MALVRVRARVRVRVGVRVRVRVGVRVRVRVGVGVSIAPAVEGGAPARLREHRPEIVDTVLAPSVATEVAAEVVLDVRGHDLDVARVQPCNR